MTDPKDTESAWDRGFEAAFAETENKPGSSVLERLGLSQDRRGSVFLREPAGDGDQSPIIKPGSNGEHVGTRKYHVVGEIARGGVGIVFKGRDIDLGRDVAMKVLRPELAGNPQLIERFVEEAQVGGQLQHPGIVPVYEIGIQEDGRPFFAMKLVKGKTLSALLKDRADITRERRRYLGIFENVCQTMAYAHARNVIHRDIKPSNVMVGSFGEVLVVDWGFAKVVREGGIEDEARAPVDLSVIETVRSGPGSSEGSVAGSVMGTPAYMPPEQARGDQAKINTRSDVFALGGVLCELLTGLPPYAEADGNQLSQALQAKLDPAFARLDRCGADEGLIRLTKRCLAAQPLVRPAHAGELAQEIHAWLSRVEERAEEARLEAEREKGRAESERKARRKTLALSALTLVALIVAGGLWGWTAKKEDDRVRLAGASVSQALVEAGQKLGTARSAPEGELAGWPAAIAAAQEAVAIAKARQADGESLARAQRFLDDVRAEERVARADAAVLSQDRRTRERLLALRLMRGPDFEIAAVDDGFRRAFEASGIDLDAMSIDALVEVVEASRIRDHLFGGLERWAHVRRRHDPDDIEGLRKLREAVKRLDPDPFRTRIRVLDDARDVRRLRRILEEGELENEPTQGLLVAGCALLELDARDDGALLLYRASKREDADFWVHAELAFSYLRFSVLNIGAHRDALEAALVADPDAYGIQYHLGKVLRAEDVERAIDSYRAVWEVDRDFGEIRQRYVDALGARLDTFLRGGSMARATGVARAMLEIEPESPTALATLGRALTQRVKAVPLHDSLPDEDRGKLEEAIEALERAVEKAPDAGWQLYLAEALNKARRFQEALDVLDRVDPADRAYARAMAFQATIYAAGGDVEQAEAHLRGMLLDPDPVLQASAIHPLMRLLRSLGRIQDALRIALERADANPGYDWYDILVSSMLIELGRFPEAEERVGEMAAKLGRRVPPDVYRNLGLAVALQGRTVEAHVHWAEMFDIYDTATERLKMRGAPTERSERQAYDLIATMYPALASYHQWDALLWLIREGRRRYPDISRLLYQELGTLIRLERGAEAVELCLGKLADDPYDANLGQFLAASVRQLPDLEERAAVVRRRIEKGSRNPLDRLLLGHLLWAGEDLEGAQREFESLAASHAKAAAPHYWLSLLHKVRQDWEACAGAARACIERSESPATGYYRLGDALSRMGRHEEARAAFEKSGQLGIGYFGHLRTCVSLFFLDGEEAGVAYARRYHLLPPLGPGSWPQLAYWLHILGGTDMALRLLERELEAHPGAILLRSAMAWFLVDRPGAAPEERERALALSNEAVAAWSDCAQVWDVHAIVSYHLGDFEGCVVALERSRNCRAFSSDPDARLVGALSLWKLGRKDEARQALAKAKEDMWERTRSFQGGLQLGLLTIMGLESYLTPAQRRLLDEAEVLMR